MTGQTEVLGCSLPGLTLIARRIEQADRAIFVLTGVVTGQAVAVFDLTVSMSRCLVELTVSAQDLTSSPLACSGVALAAYLLACGEIVLTHLTRVTVLTPGGLYVVIVGLAVTVSAALGQAVADFYEGLTRMNLSGDQGEIIIVILLHLSRCVGIHGHAELGLIGPCHRRVGRGFQVAVEIIAQRIAWLDLIHLRTPVASGPS